MIAPREFGETALFAAITAIGVVAGRGAASDDQKSTTDHRVQIRVVAPNDEAVIGELLGLMRRRLVLMHDVARAKWNAKVPAADPAREQILLGEVEKQGSALGLEPAFTRAFFVSQIEAAKLIQNADFHVWELERRGPFANAPDLRRDLRPRIDALNADLLTSLVKARPRLRGHEAIVGRLAEKTLAGEGIDAGVRFTAIRALTEMTSNGRNGSRMSRQVPLADIMPGVRDYGYLWWANGWKDRSASGARILCVRTGYFGLAIDVERLRVFHLGPITDAKPARVAVAEDNATVFTLPAAELNLEVELGQKRYRCVGVDFGAKDPLEYPVRMVESGSLAQRIDFHRLVFEDERRNRLDAEARLEVVAWPDRLGFVLEVTPVHFQDDDKAKLTMRLDGSRFPDTSVSQLDGLRTGQTIRASRVLSFDSAAGHGAITAKRPDGRAVDVAFDSARGWHRIELPSEAWQVAKDPDHLERVRLTLTNPDDGEAVLRLLFAKDGPFEGVTGLTPMLLDRDGFPTGVPVQVSKNWHQTPGRTLLYQGPWFHAFTMLRLPPRSELTCELALTYARWGGVPAASHAQLSLIGWGTNQRWDEVAIGSWGESICYDPDVCLNRSMIDDVRPLMVWGMNQKGAKWSWTNNVGGGDFLVYEDPAGRRQPLTRVRALYTDPGPNLTEATYAGVSADGGIAARLTVSSPRTDDVNRAYHRLRYDVLKPTPFHRLAFYQLGADQYNDHQFVRLARGHAGGLVEEWEPPRGGRRYSRTGIRCEGRDPWFSLHRAVSGDKKGGAWADRALVVRKWSARLGGRDVPTPFASVLGTENGIPSANVELGAPPGLTALEPGDFVDAEVELVIFPTSAKDYYGPNMALARALPHGGDTWRMAHREAVGNALKVEAARGRVVRVTAPIEVAVDEQGQAEVAVTGGLGYVPLTFSGLNGYSGMELRRDDGDGRGGRRVDQSVHGRDFWQAGFNPSSKTWSLTFNVPLDTPDDRPHTVRFSLRRPAE
jgi:chorismate mutase-like protein